MRALKAFLISSFLAFTLWGCSQDNGLTVITQNTQSATRLDLIACKNVDMKETLLANGADYWFAERTALQALNSVAVTPAEIAPQTKVLLHWPEKNNNTCRLVAVQMPEKSWMFDASEPFKTLTITMDGFTTQ